MIILGPPKNTLQKIAKALFISLSVLLLAGVYVLPGQGTGTPTAVLEVSASSDAAVEDEKPAPKKMPIASLTKLMTALVVLENYDLSATTIISEKAMAEVGQQGSLKLGEVMPVGALLKIILIESSNRAAYALAEIMGAETFVSAMNAKATQLGMTDTHFEDSTGLSGNSVSTAEDVATLSEYLFSHYPLFREIVSLKEYSLYVNGAFHHKLVNTNKMLGVLGIVGGKTGWTSEAKGCFMAVRYDNQTGNYQFYVVLGSDDRFLEMEKLINKE